MCSISDHLAQFLIYPKQNARKCLNEKTKYNRNYKKINRDKFEQDLERINSVGALKVNDKNVDTSLGIFLQIINSPLEKYAHLKQITKKEIKTKSKPWITSGISTSIRNKNKIYNKFNQKRKNLLHQQFKNYRNILSNLTKKSKENCYKEYFQENKNNLIKVWKGIKDIIVVKKHNRVLPTFLKIGNRLTPNNEKIADEFNNFFGTIAQKIDQKTPKSNKYFTDYLKKKNLSSLLLQPVSEKETMSVIGNISSRKAVGQNLILKEFKDKLKTCVTIIINIFFNR